MSYRLSLELQTFDADDYLKKRLKLLHKVHDIWTVSQVFDVARRIAPKYVGVEDPRRKHLELPKKIHVTSIIQPESGLPYNVLTVQKDVLMQVMALHLGWRMPMIRPIHGRVLKFPLQIGQKLYRPERGITAQTLRGPGEGQKIWVAATKVRGRFIPAKTKNKFIPLSYLVCWEGFKRNANRALRTGKTPVKINRKRISKTFRMRYKL